MLTDRSLAGRNDFARVGNTPSAWKPGVVAICRRRNGCHGGVRHPRVDARSGVGGSGVGSERQRSSSRCGCDARRVLLNGASTGVDLATVGFDRFPSAACIAVDVLGTSGVVLDLQALDFHGVWALAVVGQTTSPLNGTGIVIWVATSPGTDFDGHRCLRVLPVSVGGNQRANSLPVDLPSDLFRGPDDRILLESVVIAWVGVECSSVVGRSVTFAKVV